MQLHDPHEPAVRVQLKERKEKKRKKKERERKKKNNNTYEHCIIVWIRGWI